MKKSDKKNKVSAIVQARLTSTRLPGKVLMDIEGKPMLWHVVDRLKSSAEISDIILAIPDTKENDALETFCKKNNLKYFRGDESDVLKRYYDAAKKYQAEIIVRITADCPLIDAKIIDMVIRKHLVSKADYTSNVLERTFPRGLDVEVFNIKTLEKAFLEAKKDYQREHVGPYIYERPEVFHLQNVESPLSIRKPDLRLTVDTKEDLELVRKIYEALYQKDRMFSAKEIVDLISKAPELKRINARIRQKSLKA